MSNLLHPIFQLALRGIAPEPRVTRESRRCGSGFEITFRGADADEVYEAAVACKGEIDPYRSPAVVAQHPEGAEHVVVLRYYGLD